MRGNLLGSLVIDVQDYILAAVEAVDHLFLGCAVQLFVNESPFEKFPTGDHVPESLLAHEVVALPLRLAAARVPGGVRNGEVEGDSDRFELPAGLVDQSSLPRSRSAGDDV